MNLLARGARKGGVGSMNDIPAFSSTAEALGTLRAAMGFLAAADTAMSSGAACVPRTATAIQCGPAGGCTGAD